MRHLLLGVIIGVGSSAFASQAPPQPYPDSVTADPVHYKVSFENELVRFIRARYEPGERSTMHRHWASCVIYLDDQTFNFTVPDGTGGPASASAGSLGCGDGNAHAAQNIGPDSAEFIIVEFKNRETFRK